MKEENYFYPSDKDEIDTVLLNSTLSAQCCVYSKYAMQWESTDARRGCCEVGRPWSMKWIAVTLATFVKFPLKCEALFEGKRR